MNPYEILGVGRGATSAEVRAAWRRAARQTHPDTGGDPATFLRARQAYVNLCGSGPVPSSSAPVLVHRLGPPALALRWWRRRQDARRRPRVV